MKVRKVDSPSSGRD